MFSRPLYIRMKSKNVLENVYNTVKYTFVQRITLALKYIF